MNETLKPIQLARMLKTQSGFFQRFFKFCATSNTDKEAYEKVESEYSSFFIDNRYGSYQSFRSALNRFNRQQLGK